jgi:hypothetical protein
MRPMNSSLSFKIILFLALLQCILGLLRAYNWVQIGFDLFGQGLLILPFVGMIAVMRGMFISAIALLYLLSAIGALLETSWARGTCVAAVLLNLVVVAVAVIQGGPIWEGLVWSVIPVILLFNLFFSPKGTVTVRSVLRCLPFI